MSAHRTTVRVLRICTPTGRGSAWVAMAMAMAGDLLVWDLDGARSTTAPGTWTRRLAGVSSARLRGAGFLITMAVGFSRRFTDGLGCHRGLAEVRFTIGR